MRAIILLFLLVGCASTPIIDSRGGSGNIPRDAERVHDDMYTCRAIAEDHTNPIIETSKKVYNLTRARLLWIPPKAENKYKNIYQKCLEARGHSVLSWE